LTLRFVAALAVFFPLAGCGSGSIAAVSPDQLESAIRSTEAPLVVLLWGDWSRPAVEILPAAGELAAEYEGEGLAFYTVSLEQTPGKEARRVLDGFPSSARHFTLEEDPAVTLTRFGLGDVPAALLYAPSGELRSSFGSSDDAPLTPADLADAIDALLAER
jgi:thiol-disulfide isomerase/thioredoxin